MFEFKKKSRNRNKVTGLFHVFLEHGSKTCTLQNDGPQFFLHTTCFHGQTKEWLPHYIACG